MVQVDAATVDCVVCQKCVHRCLDYTHVGFLGQCPTAPQPRRGSDRACVQGGAGWCMLRCRLRGYKSTPGCASAVVSSGKAFRAGEGSYCLQIPAGPSPPCALARVQGPPPSKCRFD